MKQKVIDMIKEILIPYSVMRQSPNAYKVWWNKCQNNYSEETDLHRLIYFFDKHKIHIQLEYYHEKNKDYYGFDIILGDSGLCLHADPRFYESDYLKFYTSRSQSYYRDIIKWAFKTLERLLK